jgi:tetratricopeptide (TPR) repeat protein
MKCPVCRAIYRPVSASKELGVERGENTLPSKLCRRCGVDLSPLIHLHDQALWYHRQAIQNFKARDYAAATTQNNQALALYSNNADFHALAGQLWALQGEFRQAIKAWKKAQQLDPQHSTAGACLECLMAF